MLAYLSPFYTLAESIIEDAVHTWFFLGLGSAVGHDRISEGSAAGVIPSPMPLIHDVQGAGNYELVCDARIRPLSRRFEQLIRNVMTR